MFNKLPTPHPPVCLRLCAPSCYIANVTKSQSASWVLSCVCLPFIERWRRGGKREMRAVQHISEAWAWVLLPVCPEYQKHQKKRKEKPSEKKSSRGPRKKDLPFSSTGDYLLLPKHHRALISRELDIGSHIFPLYLFKCLFEERVLKFFLCCTIFIAPGGHPTLLLNICKLLTIFPHATFFPIWSGPSLFSMTSVWDCVSPLSPGHALYPSLLLTSSFPSYFASLPLLYTLLLLLLLLKGSSTEIPAPRFLSKFFHLPR